MSDVQFLSARIAGLEAHVSSMDAAVQLIAAEVRKLDAELERERMRLAAVSSVALGYATVDDVPTDHRSAALDDVQHLRLRLEPKREYINEI